MRYWIGIVLGVLWCSAAYAQVTRVYNVAYTVAGPACGAWTAVVDGLAVGANIGPIAVGTTLCPGGGIFCRTCTYTKRHYSFSITYPGRWAEFWDDRTNATETPPVPIGPTFMATSTQCVGSCGPPAPGILPPTYDDYSEDGVSMASLANAVGNDLVMGALPDNSLDSFFGDRSTKWSLASGEFGTAAAAIVGDEDPDAPQLKATLILVQGDLSSIASLYSGASSAFPDNAYDNLLADMTALRNLVPLGMSSTSIHFAQLNELVNHVTVMSSLNQADLVPSEYIDFLDALAQHDLDDYLSYGYALATHLGAVSVPGDPVTHSADDATGYPNPFESRTGVLFSIERAKEVTVRVVDVTGREVRMLGSGRMEAGAHYVSWDGLDANGRRATAGIYFIRVQTVQRALNVKVVRVN